MIKEFVLKNCPFCGMPIKNYEFGVNGNNRIAWLNIHCCIDISIKADAELYANGECFDWGNDALQKWNERIKDEYT